MALGRAAAWAYLPLVVLWGVYHLLALTVMDRVVTPINYDVLNFLPGFLPALPFFLIGVAFWAYFRLTVFRQGETAGQKLRRWLFATPWLEVLFLRFLPAMFYVFLLQRVYLSLKRSIPAIEPYSWDLTFAAWDRTLLMGHDAWQATHALIPGAYGASVIDQLYMAWIYVLFAGLFVAALQPVADRRRLAYLVATALSWGIGGSLIAILFSSAGPAYVQPLYGDPTFAPLMDRLHAFDREQGIAALVTIQKLWEGYSGVESVTPMGISAFPSMHLCMATLTACYARGFGRWWGAAMAVFVVLTLIGSVHLGWHYLVDGLAGIVLGLTFWAAGRAFARVWMAEPAAEREYALGIPRG